MELKNNTIFRVVRWTGTRVIMFYVLIFLLFSQLFDYESVRTKFTLATLNRIRPASYQYLWDLSDGCVVAEKKRISPYYKYFKSVAEFMPHKAGAHSVLGFLDYNLGDRDRSIQHYQNAIKHNPVVYAFYYDLGIIYYKAQDYEKSLQYLTKMISLKPEIAYLFYKDSKIYSPILMDMEGVEELDFGEKTRADYLEAYRHIVLSYYNLKKYKEMYQYSLLGLKANRKNQDFYFYAGVAAFQLDSGEKAVRYFNEYLKEVPDDKEATQWLGLSFKKIGRNLLAEKIFKITTQLPSNENVSLLHQESVRLKIF